MVLILELLIRFVSSLAGGLVGFAYAHLPAHIQSHMYLYIYIYEKTNMYMCILYNTRTRVYDSCVEGITRV